MAAKPRKSVPRRKLIRITKKIASQIAAKPVRFALRISCVAGSAVADRARHVRLTAQMLMETPTISVKPQKQKPEEAGTG